MDYWLCVSVCLHVSVFSRERYNVQMLRASLSETPGLFAECGIPNCKAVIRSLIYKFMSRLNESTNDVILAILSSDIRWTSVYSVIG